VNRTRLRCRAPRPQGQVLVERTAEIRRHDPENYEAYAHLPMPLWPDAALRSFCRGVPQLETEIDVSEPTASAIQGVVFRAIGSAVVPNEQVDSHNENSVRDQAH
jgi:hypothetical protein